MPVLYIFAYLVIAIFIIALCIRALRIASAPVHLRWELYPVMHEGERSAYGGSYLEDLEWWKAHPPKNLLCELVFMTKEILLLKALYDHNRKMWLPSLCLHYGIYLLALMGCLMVLSAIFNIVFWLNAISLIGSIGYLIGIFGAIWLLIMRSTDETLKPYSPFSAFFNLSFLLLIFLSGAYSALFSANHFEMLMEFFQGLFFTNFNPIPPPAIFHILLAVLFVLYLPFTHMTHFFIKYFTYHSVRWNDEPNLPGGKYENRIQRLLQYPLAWSARHIGADGKKNWAEIAASEVPKDEK